jgi:hypothetical protein
VSLVPPVGAHCPPAPGSLLSSGRSLVSLSFSRLRRFAWRPPPPFLLGWGSASAAVRVIVYLGRTRWGRSFSRGSVGLRRSHCARTHSCVCARSDPCAALRPGALLWPVLVPSLAHALAPSRPSSLPLTPARSLSPPLVPRRALVTALHVSSRMAGRHPPHTYLHALHTSLSLALTPSHTRTPTHAPTHMRTFTCAHTHTHTHTHSHTHYTHTRTLTFTP